MKSRYYCIRENDAKNWVLLRFVSCVPIVEPNQFSVLFCTGVNSSEGSIQQCGVEYS